MFWYFSYIRAAVRGYLCYLAPSTLVTDILPTNIYFSPIFTWIWTFSWYFRSIDCRQFSLTLTGSQDCILPVLLVSYLYPPGSCLGISQGILCRVYLLRMYIFLFVRCITMQELNIATAPPPSLCEFKCIINVCLWWFRFIQWRYLFDRSSSQAGSPWGFSGPFSN